jgi:acetyltransferase
MWIRPVVPTDAAVLAAEFAEIDEDTLYKRFFNPSFELTEERLRYLTEIDYEHHLALAAMTDEEPDADGIAIGRFAARSATDVECAIVVKADYRRLGIAKLLLERLAAAAAARGYKTMSATYLADNDGAQGLLASCGFVLVADEGDGVVDVSLDLVAAAAGSGSS